MNSCLRRSLSTIVLFLALVSVAHSADIVPPQYRPAIALVEDGDQKIKCARAGIALDKWLKKLKIQNWDVGLICAEPPRFPGAYGGSQTLTEALKAMVWVNVATDKDPEEIVIHELLHILMREVQTPLGEERAIWTLTDLLYGKKQRDI